MAGGDGVSLYYEDEYVQLHHGDYHDVLPALSSVAHVICDPPYSEHVHGAARSRVMSANDHGGRYGADLRRNVNLGFEHLQADDREFLAAEFARLADRWVLVFSDVEGGHAWRTDLATAGLDYVRTGAWIKRGSTPQFSGDRPATGFEAVTIAHPKGRKRWNGGGAHAVWDVPIVLNRARSEKSERVHPTQKPLVLMRMLVTQFTDEGEVILDPTAGGGTTGVAAKFEGRKAILIESQEQHCEASAKRLEAVEPQLVLAPASPPQAFDFSALEAGA